MTPPAVSVLMLCYNRAHFMRQAIESVLAQTFGDFEFVVMDHGSKTPEPLNIAEEYAAKDSRMRVFRVEENLGVSAGRNRLLAEARGEFVATIEDDDWWALNKLDKQTAFMRANPEVGAFYSSWHLVDKEGQVTDFRGVKSAYTQPITCATVPHGLATHTGSGQLFRRAALNAIGGWRAWFVQADDIDLVYRLEEKYRLYFSNLPLYYYRKHDDNLSVSGLLSLYDTAAWFSAHYRRSGKPEIIDGISPVETVLLRAASGKLPPRMIRKTAKRLLILNRYDILRAFLAADKKAGNGGRLKLFIKLFYWSVVNNRLGFWLQGDNKNDNGQRATKQETEQ